MKKSLPDPNVIFPIPNIKTVTYIKPTIKKPNIQVGEFSYFSDVNFEEHVTHHYDFNGDKLIIGKFCQIGAGVNFIMNGANHKMNSVTTFPFYIFEKWEQSPPPLSEMPLKGDTIVGNDVWIGQNVTILPGVKIGDGAIIGANSTVASDVPPYAIVVGNPARLIRKRFDEELIGILEDLKWWDMSIEEIQNMIPLLNDSDLPKVKKNLREMLKNNKREQLNGN
ncbi:MAG: CatB-related O-acetyltransferase [Clostridia bacterium]|nr:CatB-related O-acetyltransferase [Clostridia bacterium]